MADLVELTDLPVSIRSEELVDIWLAGANASAVRVAPCLVATDPAPTQAQLDEAKLVLVGTITRWSKAGAGGVSSTNQQAGPFGQTISLDTTVKTGYNLWPTEIERLQGICKSGKGKAFHIDTAPGGGAYHYPWCSLFFGSTRCSCGANIAGEPIYEAD